MSQTAPGTRLLAVEYVLGVIWVQTSDKDYSCTAVCSLWCVERSRRPHRAPWVWAERRRRYLYTSRLTCCKLVSLLVHTCLSAKINSWLQLMIALEDFAAILALKVRPQDSNHAFRFNWIEQLSKMFVRYLYLFKVFCCVVVCPVQVTIDILKMDIEYSEWEALEAMLASQSCLAKVKQLMVEFHTREIRTEGRGAGTSSRDDLTRYWYVLRGIYHLGFKLWNVWNNAYCNFRSKHAANMTYCGCFNMYFLNVKYII